LRGRECDNAPVTITSSLTERAQGEGSARLPGARGETASSALDRPVSGETSGTHGRRAACRSRISPTRDKTLRRSARSSKSRSFSSRSRVISTRSAWTRTNPSLKSVRLPAILGRRRPCRFRTMNFTPRRPASNIATDRPDSQSTISLPTASIHARNIGTSRSPDRPRQTYARSTIRSHANRQSASEPEASSFPQARWGAESEHEVTAPRDAPDPFGCVARPSIASQLLRPGPVTPSEASLRPEYLVDDPARVDSTKRPPRGFAPAEGSRPASVVAER
jgi:hypothetical protein